MWTARLEEGENLQTYPESKQAELGEKGLRSTAPPQSHRQLSLREDNASQTFITINPHFLGLTPSSAPL